MRNIYLAFCLLLCSCSDFYPQGGAPDGVALAKYVSETDKGIPVTESDGRTRNLSAGEYIFASVTYTNENCNRFFDSLAEYQQNSELLGKVLDLASAAGTPLAIWGTSKTVSSSLSGFFGGAKQINSTASEIYFLSDNKHQIRQLVFTKMDDFRKEKKIDERFSALMGFDAIPDDNKAKELVSTFRVVATVRKCEAGVNNLNGASCISDEFKNMGAAQQNEFMKFYPRIRFLFSHQPSDLIVARNVAASYASICSLASMRGLIGEALTSAQQKQQEASNKPDASDGSKGTTQVKPTKSEKPNPSNAQTGSKSLLSGSAPPLK